MSITMSEIWKDVPGFEGLYQVSNLGRVKSLAKPTWNGKGLFTSKEKILRPNTLAKGYFQVELKKDKKRHCLQVHRLVAMAFITNTDPNNLIQVNHLNGNKQDNRVENLEWSNNSLNQKHAWAIGLQKVSNKAGKPRRKVRLYNDSESRVFDCVADAIRFLGQKSSANIQKVLHNYPHYYTIKGYKAEYYEPVQ